MNNLLYILALLDVIIGIVFAYKLIKKNFSINSLRNLIFVYTTLCILMFTVIIFVPFIKKNSTICLALYTFIFIILTSFYICKRFNLKPFTFIKKVAGLKKAKSEYEQLKKETEELQCKFNIKQKRLENIVTSKEIIIKNLIDKYKEIKQAIQKLESRYTIQQVQLDNMIKSNKEMEKKLNEEIENLNLEKERKKDQLDNEILQKRMCLENDIKKLEIELSKMASKKVEAEKQLLSEIAQKRNILMKEINNLENEISLLTEKTFIENAIISIDENITSEEYDNKYRLLILEEKELIKSGKHINESSTKQLDKKTIKNSIKQIERCFTSEVTHSISTINVKNISYVKDKIMRTYEIINNLFASNQISISKDFLDLKLKQADFKYSCEFQKEQERLQQKAIKEQMLEEEKVRREIEKEKEKVEKEERQFKNEISKLMGYLRKSSDIEKQLYVDKIKELEEKLKLLEKDKKNILEREQNTRAGFVYIISNIGSFGEDIYKIGMTRRLEPMDRINELSSASVPFEFDVHAMIFSEDAPSLESTLHKYFDSNRVNKVNSRKEFYHVPLQDIEKVVKENFNGAVTFTKVAEAYQYRESIRLSQKN